MDSNIAFAYSTILPPQYGVEWNDEYWKRCIRGVAAQWNFNVVKNNPMAINANEIGLPIGFSQRAFFWKDYYLGQQRNIDYDHYLTREDGSRNLLKMFRGKDITKFVNYMLDECIDKIANIPNTIDVRGVSDNIVSKRKAELDYMKSLKDNKNFVSLMKSKFNVIFKTAYGEYFMNQEQENMQQVDYLDSLEEGALNVAKDIYYRNHLDEKLVEVCIDALITGAGMVYHSIVNGYEMIDRVPIYEAIFPPSVFGDQHRYDVYGGRVRFMTVPEVFATYPNIPDADKEEIQNLAKTFSGQTSFFNQFNSLGAPSFYWWNQMDGVLRVAVVHAQWASYEKDANEKQYQCLREGTLIGNKYLLNNKISTNQTEDWRNPSMTDLDYQMVQPMSIFGQNMGIPEMLYTYQNQVDSWQTKMDDFIARAKGKVYVINSSKLAAAGIKATDIVSDFSDMGITVLPDVDIDAGNMGENKIVEAIDMTIGNDVMILWNNIKEYRGMMADILNIPDAARGQMKGYQSQDMINTAASGTTKGTSYFYTPINKFLTRVLEKGVNKFKTSTLANPRMEYTLIVNDTQMEQFKSTKEFGLSKFGLRICFEDQIDKQFRQSIDNMVFGYVQNTQATGYTFSDLFEVQSMTTKREIKDYLKFRDKQIAVQRAKEAQAKAQQEQAMQQQALAAQQQQLDTKEHNENLRTVAKEESKHAGQDKEHLMQIAQNNQEQQQPTQE